LPRRSNVLKRPSFVRIFPRSPEVFFKKSRREGIRRLFAADALRAGTVA
jgi:hypothetical protein